MKRTGLLAISIGLNLALLAVVVSQRHTAARLVQTPGANDAARMARLPAKAPRATTPVATPSTSPTFNWQSVESEDYKIYIQQLRAIGCPEDTIRDIISADVRKLYEAKRAETRPKQMPKYWEAGFAQPGKHDRPYAAGLRALEQEEKQVLKELLGPGWEQAYRPYPAENVEDEALRFGDLAAEKREKIRASQKKFAELEADLMNRSLNGILSSEDEKQLEDLHQRQRKELAAILTPEELEQHDLRNSETAQNLRAGLVGLELNEQEFLNIYRWQKKMEEQTEAIKDPFDDQLAQSEKQVESQIRNLLGEKRFADFQRGSDPDFQDLHQLASGYDLPADAVLKVYDLQKQLQQAQETMARVNSNGRPRGRNPELIALQRQTAGTIKSLIGDKAFEIYQQRFGDGMSE